MFSTNIPKVHINHVKLLLALRGKNQYEIRCTHLPKNESKKKIQRENQRSTDKNIKSAMMCFPQQKRPLVQSTPCTASYKIAVTVRYKAGLKQHP